MRTYEGRLRFLITVRDEQNRPLFINRSQIRSYFRDEQVSSTPCPPATFPKIERENLEAIREGRVDDVRYDHWIAETMPLHDAGDYQLTVRVETGDRVYQSSTIRQVTYADLPGTHEHGMSRHEGHPCVYNGPGRYDSWVAELSVPKQTYEPGEVFTASVNLLSEYYSSSAWVSCSYADPDSIKVDGQLVSRSQVYSGTAQFYPHSTPYSADLPSYKVQLTGLGQHTVEFRLLPDYVGRNFNFTTRWLGPFVVVGTNSPMPWDEAEGFVTCGDNHVVLNNARAVPEAFGRGESTRIKADISNVDLPPVTWTITIRDPAGELVRTLSGSGTTVDRAWTGWSTPANDYAPYGVYSWRIDATSAHGTTGEASGTVAFIPPLPTLTRVEAEASIRLYDDSDAPISRVYYDEWGYPETHPIAVPVMGDAYVDAPTGNEITERTATREPIYPGLPDPTKVNAVIKYRWDEWGDYPSGTYVVRAETPEGEVLVQDQEFSFPELPSEVQDPSSSEAQIIVPMRMPGWVQEIYKVIWRVRRKGDPIVMGRYTTTEENIYVTLGKPLEPFGAEPIAFPDLRVGVKLDTMKRACKFGNGAINPGEARYYTTQRAYEWLALSHPGGGSYNPSDFSHTDDGGATFHLTEFLNDTDGGDCMDTSSFFVLHCAALGVPAQLVQVWRESDLSWLDFKPSKGWTHGIADPALFTVSDWDEFNFNFHQVGTVEGKVWDACLAIKTTPTGDWWGRTLFQNDWADIIMNNGSTAVWYAPYTLSKFD